MREVVLHVYDVTNSGSDRANNTILQINRIFKDRIGIGGIFHSAIQVFGDEEWSFGYCERGSGVFCCPSRRNPLYTYRESIVLGETNFTFARVNQILRELSREWPGCSYELLSRNCNHFCDAFCDRLDVPKLPAWVNRFANAGDTALEVAENTALKLRQAKTEIVSASKAAYSFIAGVASNRAATAENPPDEQTGISRYQPAWFKNLVSVGVKPSSSSSEVQEESTNNTMQHQEEIKEKHISLVP